MPSLDHALVLTAGLGTRLNPLTLVRAKPAVPVAGTPIVRHVAAWLARHGVTDLVLNLHHLPHTITGVVGDGSDLGVRVRYSWEQPVVLGTAGGPRHALALLGGDPFFLINGDTLTDVNLGAVAAAHLASEALVTLVVVPNRAPDRYGGVIVSDGRVRGFVARGAAARQSFHFAGVQVVHAEVFADLADNVPFNSIGGVYDRWLERRPGSIRAFACDAAFWDVGTIGDYWTTSAALAGGLDAIPCGRDVHIAPSARVRRSIVWDGVQIGDRSDVDECIVTDGVHVPPGSAFRRATLVRTADGSVTSFPFLEQTEP